jgi:hypothetical protein
VGIANRIDTWIGKTLFVPLIVRFCQKSGWTQFAVHNYLYLIGSYMLLVAAMAKGKGEAMPFVLALILTIKIGRDPQYPGYESKFLRWCFILTTPVHVLSHLTGEPLLFAGPDLDLSCPVSLMWLTAEYARTIKTIPPLESEKPASQQVVAVKARKA